MAVDLSVGNWERHFSEDGHAYFYNTVTEEVQWDTAAEEGGDATAAVAAAWDESSAHYSETASTWGGGDGTSMADLTEVYYDVEPDAYSQAAPAGHTNEFGEFLADEAAYDGGSGMVADAAADQETYGGVAYDGAGGSAAIEEVEAAALSTAAEATADGAGAASSADAPLEEGWEEIRDQSGATYYWNGATGESRWERPARLVRMMMRATSAVSAAYASMAGHATSTTDPDHSAEDAAAAAAAAAVTVAQEEQLPQKEQLEPGWEPQQDENGYERARVSGGNPAALRSDISSAFHCTRRAGVSRPALLTIVVPTLLNCASIRRASFLTVISIRFYSLFVILFDSARFGLFRFGSVRFDSIRFFLIRFGSVRFDSIRFGSVRFDSILASIWFGLVRRDSIRPFLVFFM
jgi:hypothetical protein